METWQEAACYIRVSTEDQTEYSPEAQHRALEHYARQHQLTISPEHVYIDAGISGRRAETRPAFMAMIAAAKKRPPPFSVILVHKFDRFARNREDSIVYKSMLRSASCQYHRTPGRRQNEPDFRSHAGGYGGILLD